MLFIFSANDKPNSIQIRLDNRPDHLEFLQTANDNGVKLLLAGPIVNKNEEMIGSRIIAEAEDEQTIQNWLNQDPYAKADLFEEASLNEFKIGINNFV